MKLNINFSKLTELAKKINGFGSILIERTRKPFEPIDLEISQGISVDASEIEFHDGLITYKGRQVLLYIKDHSYDNSRSYDEAILDGSKGRKFHIAQCTTLTNMFAKGRLQRYVATNNLTGQFLISAQNRKDAFAQLNVCQNCLSYLNYKNSRGDNHTRYQNVLNFNIGEFFKTYSAHFDHLPYYTDKDSVTYSSDWREISRRVRAENGYQCNRCRVSLMKVKHLCHAHHINGAKQDNRRENLEVLCIDCHRKEHIGHMFLTHEEMRIITQLRKEQGLLEQRDWDAIYLYGDPALFGAFEHFYQQNWQPPLIGYQLSLEGGAYLLDAAWPEQNYALSLRPKAISGWTIESPNQSMQFR